MAITLKSFEILPAAEDAQGKRRMNVPETERKMSTAAGAGLLIAGLLFGGVSRWVLGGIGAALVGRGLSGYCPYYHLKHENRRPIAFRDTAQ